MSVTSINHRKVITRMASAALILALCVVFMKFLPISVPVLPYARISLGPALIIFASFALGPYWGLVIGAGADLIGFLFDTTGYGYFPGITIMYGLLGLFAHILFRVVKSVKNTSNLQAIFVVMIACLLLLCTVSILKMDSITLNLQQVEFGIVYKLCLITLVYCLAMVTIVIIFLYQRHMEKKQKGGSLLAMQVSITVMILEIIIIMFFGAFVKSLHFGMNFTVVVFTQLIIFFINVPLNTFIVTLLQKTVSRYLV